MAREQRGGLLVRLRAAPGATGGLWFVPAEIAVGVASLSAVTRVPGVRPPASGMALASGSVVTTLELPGPPSDASLDDEPSVDEWAMPGPDRAVVCDVGGELVALTGGDVVATGIFEAWSDGVLWHGRAVPALDVRALYARAEAAIWTERAAVAARGGST